MLLMGGYLQNRHPIAFDDAPRIARNLCRLESAARDHVGGSFHPRRIAVVD